MASPTFEQIRAAAEEQQSQVLVGTVTAVEPLSVQFGNAVETTNTVLVKAESYLDPVVGDKVACWKVQNYYLVLDAIESDGPALTVAKNDEFVLYTNSPDQRIWFNDREVDTNGLFVAGDTFTPVLEGWYEVSLNVTVPRSISAVAQDPVEVVGTLNAEVRRDGTSGLTEVARDEVAYSAPIDFSDGYTYQGYPGVNVSGYVYCNGTDDDIYAVGTFRTYSGLPPRWKKFFCRMSIKYLGPSTSQASTDLYSYSFTTPDPSIWLAGDQVGFPVDNSGANGIVSPMIDNSDTLSNNFVPNGSHTNPTDAGDYWTFDSAGDRIYVAGYGPGFKSNGFTAAICMRYVTSWPWAAGDQILGHQSSSGFTSEIHLVADTTAGQFRAYIEDDYLGGIVYDTGYTAITGAGSADTWFILVVAVDEDGIAIGVPGTTDATDSTAAGSNVVRDSYRNYMRLNAGGKATWDVAGVYMWDAYIAPSQITLTTTDFGL